MDVLQTDLYKTWTVRYDLLPTLLLCYFKSIKNEILITTTSGFLEIIDSFYLRL